jgi:hypothetical protein
MFLLNDFIKSQKARLVFAIIFGIAALIFIAERGYALGKWFRALE